MTVVRPILDYGQGLTVWRVPISVPCQAPVVPGTPDTSAQIEQRTERCAVDGYWMIGRAYLCDLHLRSALEDHIWDDVIEHYPWVELETKPWDQQHRYDQADAEPDWQALGYDGNMQEEIP